MQLRTHRDVATSALDLTVDALATYRLTRLATKDVISEPARRAVVDRLADTDQRPEDETAQEIVDGLDRPPSAARLITCRWCAGIWIAGGVVVARAAAPRLWGPVARGLALSSAAVLIARAESD
jgi:hypothetical protein